MTQLEVARKLLADANARIFDLECACAEQANAIGNLKDNLDERCGEVINLHWKLDDLAIEVDNLKGSLDDQYNEIDDLEDDLDVQANEIDDLEDKLDQVKTIPAKLKNLKRKYNVFIDEYEPCNAYDQRESEGDECPAQSSEETSNPRSSRLRRQKLSRNSKTALRAQLRDVQNELEEQIAETNAAKAELCHALGSSPLGTCDPEVPPWSPEQSSTSTLAQGLPQSASKFPSHVASRNAISPQYSLISPYMPASPGDYGQYGCISPQYVPTSPSRGPTSPFRAPPNVGHEETPTSPPYVPSSPIYTAEDTPADPFFPWASLY